MPRGLRSGSGSLDAGFELRVTSYEVRVKYWLLVAGWSVAEIPIYRGYWMLDADFAIVSSTAAESGNADSSGMPVTDN
ncbi:MAG: hypothetical protein JRJ46_11110 [Deltaproteobacteria bacterium]|nr:hypothetical protein [Deltaproteobacteria bacterium]